MEKKSVDLPVIRQQLRSIPCWSCQSHERMKVRRGRSFRGEVSQSRIKLKTNDSFSSSSAFIPFSLNPGEWQRICRINEWRETKVYLEGIIGAKRVSYQREKNDNRKLNCLSYYCPVEWVKCLLISPDIAREIEEEERNLCENNSFCRWVGSKESRVNFQRLHIKRQGREWFKARNRSKEF